MCEVLRAKELDRERDRDDQQDRGPRRRDRQQCVSPTGAHLLRKEIDQQENGEADHERLARQQLFGEKKLDGRRQGQDSSHQEGRPTLTDQDLVEKQQHERRNKRDSQVEMALRLRHHVWRKSVHKAC